MLEVRALSKVYPSGVHALETFTLSVKEGEIVAVIGGSGCGKSTLLRLISGLDRASSGTIEIDGEAISAPHPLVHLIFQEPRLLPWLRVIDNVAFGLDHFSARARREQAMAELERVGLADYAGRWPKELSGGQAQRAAIARGLVTRPEVLLLDEPFSALDAFTRAELQEQLVELWHQHGVTMIVVTHDIDEALFLADRIVVMQPRPGRIFDVVPVTLGRPRGRAGHEFGEARQELLAILDRSMGPRVRRVAR